MTGGDDQRPTGHWAARLTQTGGSLSESWHVDRSTERWLPVPDAQPDIAGAALLFATSARIGAGAPQCRLLKRTPPPRRIRSVAEGADSGLSLPSVPGHPRWRVFGAEGRLHHDRSNRRSIGGL